MAVRWLRGLLLLSAAGLIGYAAWDAAHSRPLRSAIACAMRGETLYVVESLDNALLALQPVGPGRPMRLVGRWRIEPDDDRYYYMIRFLYPGRDGLVVQSNVYERESKRFIGYRLREYVSFAAPGRDILSIHFSNPETVPDFSYAFGPQGAHYLVHNIAGRRNVWRLPAEGGAVLADEGAPLPGDELGDTNDQLSNWTSICVAADGRIFVSSGSSDRVVEYDSAGRRVRELGRPGFEEGDLLAPEDVFFVRLAAGEPERLTVASAGNRTWVQFDESGAVVRTLTPLESGYPASDILVGRVYESAERAGLLAFDRVNGYLVHLGPPLRVSQSYRAGVRGRTAACSLAALLLVFATTQAGRLRRPLARLRFPFLLKMTLLFAPLQVIGGVAAAVIVGTHLSGHLTEEYYRRAANLANAVLSSISLEDLEAIQDPADRAGPAYSRVHGTIDRLMERQSVPYTPKWILHKIRDGHYYFGVNVWRGPLYEPFIVPAERLIYREALLTRQPQRGITRDEQGEWISYLQPVLGRSGQVIYVLELYHNTEAFRRVARETEVRIGLTVAAAVVLVLIIATLASYHFTRPLRQLIRAAERIRGGDLDQRVVVRTRDEMADLAVAMDEMTAGLKKYTADLARATAEKQRYESELELARRIQQSVLPQVFPPYPGAEDVRIVTRMEPARVVAGDYFDFFLVDRNHIGVVIADVSGKGAAAGLCMMHTRFLLRYASAGNLSASDVVSSASSSFCTEGPPDTFVTLFYLICDMRTGEVSFCNAGHEPPLHLRRDGTGLLGVGRDEGGVPVGVVPDAKYPEGRFRMGRGESLLLFTDGVTECFSAAGDLFGRARLLETVRNLVGLDPEAVVDGLLSRLEQFREGAERSDDVSLLLFRFGA